VCSSHTLQRIMQLLPVGATLPGHKSLLAVVQTIDSLLPSTTSIQILDFFLQYGRDILRPVTCLVAVTLQIGSDAMGAP